MPNATPTMNNTTEGPQGSANSKTPITDRHAGIAISHPHFASIIADMAQLERQLAQSEERVKELEGALREAQKDAEDMLGMIEDYDGLDWGEDGPPFTPCTDELQERIDQRAALLSSKTSKTN